MEFLYNITINPFIEIATGPAAFIEVALGGLMSGVMYSLVALGFVLIYKASGVFNYAQGVMVLFAALFFVGFIDSGVPIWLALPLTIGVMLLLAWTVERVVLRKLVNQPEITLFMATIGVAFFLEGLGEAIWGGDVRVLEVGVPKDSWFINLGGFFNKFSFWKSDDDFTHEIIVQQADLVAAIIAGALVIVLALFFQYTKTGRALRAVADDHQAALTVGIALERIWFIVWAVAGFVALVAGIMWGSKLGVQFSLAIIALKALPVLILGGFDSVPGAIIGGLIIGVGEKVAEAYWGPPLGGAIEEWFAYFIALAVLVFRPQGLFGERIIERV